MRSLKQQGMQRAQSYRPYTVMTLLFYVTTVIVRTSSCCNCKPYARNIVFMHTSVPIVRVCSERGVRNLALTILRSHMTPNTIASLALRSPATKLPILLASLIVPALSSPANRPMPEFLFISSRLSVLDSRSTGIASSSTAPMSSLPSRGSTSQLVKV